MFPLSFTQEAKEFLHILGRDDTTTTSQEREARFIELGRRGANASTKHPDRPEWLRLRDMLAINCT
jgi:hypothetical protein